MFKLLFCLIVVVTISIPNVSFAQNNEPRVSGGQVNEALANMPHTRFLPNNPIYYFVRVKEVFGRFFNASAVDRAEFDLMISSKRLKEIYLLLLDGKYTKANGLRDDYSRSLDKNIDQLRKAESQNQETLPLLDEIIDELNYQETLIISLQDTANDESAQDFDTYYLEQSFDSYISELEQFKPGLRSRFKLLKENIAAPKETMAPSPSPIIFVTTGSAKPRRIIY